MAELPRLRKQKIERSVVWEATEVRMLAASLLSIVFESTVPGVRIRMPVCWGLNPINPNLGSQQR